MQFIDQVEVQVKAGDGGDGLVAFRREKYVPAGGPSGGNGGKGGSVIVRATERLQTLLDFRYKHLFRAENGKRGGPNNRTGANGGDLFLEVPCGTLITDAETGEWVGDLIENEQTLVIAQGGKGGLGNQHFLSNRNRAPDYALPGLEGEEGRFRFELKLLADVGIIGLPNAGKSTFISVVSAAQPKIANYPFTTLIPNLGVVRKPTGDGTVFADIPGLIEGAAEGIGLGHDFLRHIERTRVLLHLIDSTEPDIFTVYNTIQQELVAYGKGLENRPQVIGLNKMDAVDRSEDWEAIADSLREYTGSPVFLLSAATQTGIQEILQIIWQILEQQPHPLVEGIL